MLPLVRQFLPGDYFHHFVVLVTAITMLLSKPTHKEVEIADIILKYFVKEMDPLYEPESMTMNTHSPCHLAQQLRDHGPLWSNSMFPFESTIKEIGYLYCGTRNVGDLIVQRFYLRQQLARSHHSTNKIVDKYAVQLRLRRNRYSSGNTNTVSDNVTFFLPMTQETL
jgi:hypothetical protein